MRKSVSRKLLTLLCVLSMFVTTLTVPAAELPGEASESLPEEEFVLGDEETFAAEETEAAEETDAEEETEAAEETAAAEETEAEEETEAAEEPAVTEETEAEEETEAAEETETAEETEAAEETAAEEAVPEEVPAPEEAEEDLIAAPAAESTVKTVMLSAKEKYAQDFATRMYQLCLGREPEAEGLEYWTKQIATGATDGATAAYGFVFSKEYKNSKANIKEYVSMLYQVILGREPDEDGLNYWTEFLKLGLSRQYVFEGFVKSKEFSNICKQYKVKTGTYTSNNYYDIHSNVTLFVGRLYKNFLSRYPDLTGKKYWVQNLVKKKMTGAEVISGFALSDEFKALNLPNEEALELFYQSCFDRTADDAGKKYWLKYMDKGVTYNFLAKGFSESDEFKNLCKKFNINPGSVTLTDGRDLYPDIAGYVQKYYKTALGIGLTDAAGKNYVKKLGDGVLTGQDFVTAFFTSKAYANKNRTDEEFLNDLYVSVLGRKPDEEGLAHNLQLLADGTSREEMIQSFAESSAAKKRYTNYKIRYIADGFNSKGQYYKNNKMLSGWQTIDGNTYYFNPSNDNIRTTGSRYIGEYKYFFTDKGVLRKDLRSQFGGPYLIRVNKQSSTITVYVRDSETGNYTIPIVAFICSCGEATPLGTHHLQEKYRWHELNGPVWGQWCTRYYTGMLFHSVYYDSYNNNFDLSISAYNALGTIASHGCIRIQASTAKWIYENVSSGTTVIIYNSSTPGPFGKPSSYKLPSWHLWDPTDPTANWKCREMGCHDV